MMFDTQRHRIGKKFFEGVWRHDFEAVGVDTVHELLKSEDGNVNARALQGFRGHDAGKEPPNDGRDEQAHDEYGNRAEEIGPSEILQNCERDENGEGCADAVAVCGFGIERVNAFLFPAPT